MSIFSLLPFLVFLVYFAIVIGVFYLIYTWVKKFISLKQEHNALLRELISKMDQK